MSTGKTRISYRIPTQSSNNSWHFNGINCIAVDEYDGSIWTGGRDALLINQKGKSKTVYSGHSDWINDVKITKNSVITASSDRSIIVWNKDSNHVLGYHNDYIKCLSAHKSSPRVFSAGLDKNIILWDIAEGRQCSLIEKSKTGIYSIASSSAGNIVIYGGLGGLLKIIDTRIDKNGISLVGHKDAVKSILFDDSHTLVSGCADSMIKIWDVRNLACTLTLGFESPVWTCATPTGASDLNVFWVGCRDGSVVKGIPSCLISVCRGDARVTSRPQPGYHFTPSESLKSLEGRPTDRPLSIIMTKVLDVGGKFEEVEGSDCVLVCKTANPVTGIAATENGDVWVCDTGSDLNLYSDFHVGRGSRVPGTCLIKQAPALASDFSADIEDDAKDDPVPLYQEPIDTIAGGCSLIKYAILNDRRRVVVLDSIGNVSIWDIIRCKRLKLVSRSRFHSMDRIETEQIVDAASAYGNLKSKEIFDKVVAESNSIVWVANWCTIDLKIGALVIHLDEPRCFDAESYHHDLALEPNADDTRINIGRWVLTNLFLNYTYKIHSMNRSPLIPNINTPVKDESSFTPPVMDSSTPLKSSPGRTTLPNTSPTPPVRIDSESSPTSAGFMNRLKGHMRIKSGDMLWKKKKKTDEETEEPESSDEEESDEPPRPIPPLRLPGSSLEALDLPFATIQQKNSMQVFSVTYIQEIIPFLNIEETPLIDLPKDIKVSISTEESPEACGYLELTSCTLEEMGENNAEFERMKRHIPSWINDFIVQGKSLTRESVKVSFLLVPYDVAGVKPLKELPNGGNRLSANRMLRVRKLAGYVYERITVEDDGKGEPGETTQQKAERLLEIVCQDKVLDPTTTLASLKYQIWKGGELELKYRRRVK